MFKLERLNVVKIVATEYEKEKLISKGFELVEEDKEEKTIEEATEEKKEEKPKGKVAK